jgi:hypothetical protein
MRKKAAVWGVLAAILLIALVLPAQKPAGRAKTRAQRITTVNSVRSVTMTLPATNGLSRTQAGGGK